MGLVVDVVYGSCYLERSFSVVGKSGRGSQDIAVTEKCGAAATPGWSICCIVIWLSNS